MTKEELARKEQTIVRICANGHPTVTYYARRDQPEPPCPYCHVAQGAPRDASE